MRKGTTLHKMQYLPLIFSNRHHSKASRLLGFWLGLPYSLDQTPLSISRRSLIVAVSPQVLNDMVTALK